MKIEILEDVPRRISNKLGVYGCCNPAENEENCDSGKRFCCRTGFMMTYEDRIRQAIENEKHRRKVVFRKRSRSIPDNGCACIVVADFETTKSHLKINIMRKENMIKPQNPQCASVVSHSTVVFNEVRITTQAYQRQIF
jgi:hypothetical protein